MAADLRRSAAAGLLSEIFVADLTAVRATCACCGAIRALGALLVYAQSMGPVIRCPECRAVVLRVARIRNQLWLDPTGARLVFMPEPPAPSHLTGSSMSMHLTPREVEKLNIFTTGEFATRRRARGLKINHPEPVALIASEVLELIRDRKAVAETMSIWSTLLPLDAVMEGARAGEPNTQMTERQLP